VCNDCVPPSTAASASTQVRTTLLYGSCSASDHPEVWECVRRASERGSRGSKRFISFAQSTRAARSFAVSMKRFMPIPKKKERRGANASMPSPAAMPVRTYSRPSASV